MMKIYLFLSILVLCAPGAAIAVPGDYDVSFERIVDTSTPLPNAPEYNFGLINSQLMVNSKSGVMFSNAWLDAFRPSIGGVYQWKNGNLQTVVDSTQSPFTNDLFGFDFQGMYSDGVNSVVRASGHGDADSGIYLVGANASPQLIFERGSPLPDGAGNASNVFWPRVNQGNVVFTAKGDDGLERVYRTDLNGGPVTTLLDENSPGFKGIESFALGDFEDGYFAFRSIDNDPYGPTHTGVYTSDLDGNVNTIARLGDPLPGAPGQTIRRVAGDTVHPSISDGKVVYTANGSGGTDGIYIAPVTGGASEVVIDDTMKLPGIPDGIVTSFALASISGDNVSFLGSVFGGGTSDGLWVSMDGTLVDIVIRNQEFDGRTINRIFTSPFSMYDNTVAFEIVFTDNTRGLYLATITPAPGGVVVFGLAGAWAVRRRRKALTSV